MSSSAGSPSGLRPTLLVTLALLMAAAPIATDLYLPAFPEMADEFATTATGVQLSLTAFMIGAGLGQVVFGPLSDRAGRVRPLLIGTGVYVLASAAAAMAGSIPWLVAARLVQGISGAAGMVLARAIVSDLTTGREAARAFSLLMLVGGVAPVVAPLAGSLLAGSIGWRGLLWVVAGIAAISLLAALCVYGGFFNAGLGIMLLAFLALAGMTDIHAMNGLKLWISSVVALIAVVRFALSGSIDWYHGSIVLAGVVVGAYAAARLAHRVPTAVLRGLVIVYASALTAWFFYTAYFS